MKYRALATVAPPVPLRLLASPTLHRPHTYAVRRRRQMVEAERVGEMVRIPHHEPPPTLPWGLRGAVPPHGTVY